MAKLIIKDNDKVIEEIEIPPYEFKENEKLEKIDGQWCLVTYPDNLKEDFRNWLHRFKGINDALFEITYRNKEKSNTICTKHIRGGDLLISTIEKDFDLRNLIRIERIL